MSEAPYARSTVKHFLPTLLDFADRLDLLLGVSSHRFLYFEKRFKFNFWIRMGRGGRGAYNKNCCFHIALVVMLEKFKRTECMQTVPASTHNTIWRNCYFYKELL